MLSNNLTFPYSSSLQGCMIRIHLLSFLLLGTLISREIAKKKKKKKVDGMTGKGKVSK